MGNSYDSGDTCLPYLLSNGTFADGNKREHELLDFLYMQVMIKIFYVMESDRYYIFEVLRIKKERNKSSSLYYGKGFDFHFISFDPKYLM